MDSHANHAKRRDAQTTKRVSKPARFYIEREGEDAMEGMARTSGARRLVHRARQRFTEDLYVLQVTQYVWAAAWTASFAERRAGILCRAEMPL